MLLVDHKAIMDIAENHLTLILVAAAALLLFIAFFTNKKVKAHVMAYTIFP